jgi:hypothetical protein
VIAIPTEDITGVDRYNAAIDVAIDPLEDSRLEPT